ncbi:MAG: HU family DNA-binding protein [Proteobacteria bacterium]|jgi:nucleoid DNA-binding protein|nr:HU family DNA-binding protein [Desulfobacterales bacterium]MBL6967225.1 HU family DNA-binding protein [Desulfobacteraceae bacterium]MBL7171620.1 HU family DNA-binding protein [Desulfobacteraceae bacterium]MBU0733416.1 HU family DNA-binding protein [Pseudomonadota bacterium]MBU1902204.1 HU family DNA-binding protein [Pseudomonadota bacterium]
MAAKKIGKKVAAKKPAAKKIPAVKKPMTKAEILNEIAGNTGLTKKQVSSVFEEVAILIERHIKKRSPGQFTFPGLLKIEVKVKPATKARKGINPFTGEATVFKAKPARRAVKVRPLKKVKEMVD